MRTENSAKTEDSLDLITDALLTASRLLVAISARSIAHVDETITIPQFRTLVILSNHGPMNLGTLAGRLGVQRSAAGRMVDRLVAVGLIDRQNMGNYIPMIGEAFWATLSPALKSLVTDLWAANIGTETGGSILNPSNQNMLVGIKPTLGRTSRWGVIPITADQDSAL